MSQLLRMHRQWKLLLLLSCFATILATSPVAFAQDEPTPTAAKAAEGDALPKGVTEGNKEATIDEAAVEEEGEPLTPEVVQAEGDHLWTLIAAILVFWMQAGFALVEAGFTRAKNAANIMMKNAADMCFGGITFWIVGYGLMFGPSDSYGIIGTGDFLFSGVGSDGSIDEANMVFWIFQSVFAATAATIVSGCMAGRTNFPAYIIFSCCITAFIYPVFGKWAWGSLFLDDGAGWLEDKWGFLDFAGSTVVHSIGGWCGLAGAIAVGPRIGKYGADGKPKVIAGHNMVYGMIGTFILWMGWFGFNAGSTTAIGGSEFAHTATTTMLAACAGGLIAMLTSKAMYGKWDLGITANGVLGGLVAITAPCYDVSLLSAVIIGGIAGIIIPCSIKFFDNIKVDDPVGALSVHLVCGIWGTLAIAIFAQEIYGGNSGLIEGNPGLILPQLVGIAAAGLWAFPVSFIVFKIVDAIVGLRVAPEVEEQGLDIDEHGIGAYPSHVVFDAGSGHV
ncbi:Ammonium transporter NrgA [Planctomycetes bacterium Pan216]|uniref:Ammonium transporter n=1 Tax=Kolteria novifilia TaxID=2527975 RepID=A0A518B1X5_9BACT|nr:Ammonium transporter NrgA [Planctomycetes bacterium Pan216]